MNDVAERGQSQPLAIPQQRALTAADVRSHVNLIQQVMEGVMKADTHYGVIPGTKKPTLYKPGAEVLAATFRIAVSYRTEDLSTPECIRYRVTAIGTHQVTGIVMGEGIGECSSFEEKYKWRRAICEEEFEATPETHRRIKFGRYQGKVERTKQVRCEAADQANTILKMAAKRAQVAMTLNVTAASDIFMQDIEDLPEHLLEEEAQAPPQPTTKQPYDEDDFKANMPAWKNLVAKKKKTPKDILATVESKYLLLDKQRKEILAIGAPTPSAPAAGDAP